jgi:predicted thioesterase
MLPQVLATPVMILIMERRPQRHRPFLDIGESAVGTAINVRHLAATPVGHDVRAEAAACGHLPYLEDPTGFNILVSDFVA